MTFDKTKETCEANNSSTTTPVPTNNASGSTDYISKLESNSCTIWYDQYGLCLKGVKGSANGSTKATGVQSDIPDGVTTMNLACQQKNLLIPAGLMFGGLFFALFAIMSLF